MILRFEKQQHIGKIILDNPPYNQLDSPLFADKKSFEKFVYDPELKGLIVRGAGRHFSSGANPDTFSSLFNDPESMEKLLNQAKDLLTILSFAPVPTIAVITGSCLGAGLEIGLSCHFRFAAKSAMLGFPETHHSLLPGMGGTVISQKIVTRANLVDLIISGKMIGGEEALKIGLVDSIGSKKEIETLAFEYLETLTKNHSPELIRTVMQSIHNSSRMSTEEALQEESRLFCKLARRTHTKLHEDNNLSSVM